MTEIPSGDPSAWPARAQQDVAALEQTIADLQAQLAATQAAPAPTSANVPPAPPAVTAPSDAEQLAAAQPAPTPDVPASTPPAGDPNVTIGAGVSATPGVDPSQQQPAAAPDAQPPNPPAPPVDTSVPPLSVGKVVTFTYPESGSGAPITRYGLVVAAVASDGVNPAANRVAWLNEISDPVPVAQLLEVT